jgi:ketosteroid isomerase-like protein
MPARSPEEICTLFQQYMAAGDVAALRDLYDPDVVFIGQSGELRKGWEGLKHELAPFANAHTAFEFTPKQLLQAADIALMHTEWRVSSPEPITLYAIEVARRQPDGSWRWLIGDPFTVNRYLNQSRQAA